MACMAWMFGGVAGKVACPAASKSFYLGSSLDTKQGSGDLRTGGYVFPASLKR